MTEEQIKQKAKTYSKNYWYNTNNSVNVASIEKLLIDFATETTKEFESQIEQLVYFHNEDVNTIKLLNKQIEKMKSQYDYAFNQLCKSREILCSMLSQYRDTKEIDYSTRECGEELLKEGVYKND